MTEPCKRSTLFRFVGWFALANSVVFGLVSLRYFSGGLPEPSALSTLYLFAVYIGHHVMLTVVPLFLVSLPFILFKPSRRLLTVVAVILFAFMIALMMLDSLLWSQSRFHINGLTIRILGWPSWVFTGVIFAIGLFFQATLARNVWSFVEKKKRRRGGWLATFCVLMIVTSQAIHAWADAAYYVPVTALGQVLPVYKGVTAKSLMTRSGLVDMKAARERELARRVSMDLDESADRLLNYPLAPLQCGDKPPMNLLFIVVDSMRGMALTEDYAPRMTGFARQSINFQNHFSGGNSSRMGMFSLFYGLPPGYWSSFSSMQRSTVLMDELQRREYQLGLYSSATLIRPVVLDRTAFARVPNLRLATEPRSDPPWKRDRVITDEWFQWLDDRDAGKPFFGFLFYDTTMTQRPPPDYQNPVIAETDDDAARQRAVYHTAVRFNDDLVGEVLDDLVQRGLMDDTVVVITADHGEEFAESSEKLTEHGSGYTRYQLLTPMIVSWPGQEPAAYEHRTSHYDLVPTLMQDLLGCENPASDYSVGTNLFELQEWPWMVAGSYFNYAVLEPDQVTVTFPSGRYEVRDWDYRLLKQPQFRGDVLEAVSEQNSRYFVD